MDGLATGMCFWTGRRFFFLVFIIITAVSFNGCAIQGPSLKLDLSDRRVIQGIEVSKTKITVSANRRFIYRVRKENSHPGLVILLEETYPGQYGQPISVSNGVVTTIIPRRVVRRGGEWGTELHIGLKSHIDYQVLDEGNKLIIALKDKRSNLSKVASKIGGMRDEPQAQEPSSGTESLNDEVGDYVIGPEDVLEIIVWKNAELSKVVTVRPDGRISLPLIGDIQAADVTADALRKSIRERLKEFQKVPAVSVIVQEVNSFSVFILGEVARPGKLQLRSETTFLQALTLSGGFTQFAAVKKIVLLRRENGRDQRIEINYNDIVTGKNPDGNILLKRGDTIVVP